MNLFSKLFGKIKTSIIKGFTKFKELGSYQAVFAPFGDDMARSEIVRACLRPLAEHTSKANPKCSNKELQALLEYRPNIYMNGKDFLSKCRNIFEIKNTLFIYINRDDRGKVTGLYPVPYHTYEALEYAGGLFVKFRFINSSQELIAPWEDLAVLRKDYIMKDLGGDDNSPIISTLDLISTTNQGISNAVKSTANLRGILKSNRSMLDEEDTKAIRDDFIKDYMNLANEGGIAVIDATTDFVPVSMSPTMTSYTQMREFRENVYRYFGVSDEIIMAKADEQVMETFYETRIEPFLVAMSLELTSKIFTSREIAFGNRIHYESNRMQYASTKTKLALLAMVDRGAMTPNEWREVFNLAPVEGGDKPIRRLDTQPVNEKKEEEDE